MSQDDTAEAAERIYGAVADDEGLRGELDDAGYAPLLSWAAQQADALAAEPGVDVDAAAERLRDAVAALVAACESGDPRHLDSVPSELLPLVDRVQARAALARALSDPNERAAALARALTRPENPGGTTDGDVAPESEASR